MLAYLVLQFSFLLVLQTDSSERLYADALWEDESVQNTTANGLVVSVNPELLVGDGLNRAWRNVDEPNGKIHVRSNPLSKVNFELQPMHSHDGAVAELSMRGVSVGKTRASTSKVEIVSDSLTKFDSCQTIVFSLDGISFSEPQIRVNANQSLDRSKAKKGGFFAAKLTSAYYRKFPENVKQRAEAFSEKLVRKHLLETMNLLSSFYLDAMQRLANRFPTLFSLGWSAHSDNQNLYFSAHQETATPQTELRPPESAIGVTLSSGYAESFARSSLGAKRFSHEQFEAFFAQFNREPKQEKTNSKPWFITFNESPIKINFENDQVNLRLAVKEFSIERRRIPDIFISVNYEIGFDGKEWVIHRVGAIAVEARKAGARQQMVRSVIRKKASSLFPEQFVLPSLPMTPQMKKMDLDLAISGVKTENQFLYVLIDQKR